MGGYTGSAVLVEKFGLVMAWISIVHGYCFLGLVLLCAFLMFELSFPLGNGGCPALTGGDQQTDTFTSR